MKWIFDSEVRQAILFIFGLAGITEQIVVSAGGGPAPDRNLLILFGIFALGAPTARALISAWKGFDDSKSNDDDGNGETHES